VPKSKPFDEKYPIIHRFVEEIGWIEIGQHEMISAFVRAYDLGGTVYEGKDSYPNMEAALQDLEAGIKAYLDEHGI
jgi:exodeoxyribonuclease V alpha subunit